MPTSQVSGGTGGQNVLRRLAQPPIVAFNLLEELKARVITN